MLCRDFSYLRVTSAGRCLTGSLTKGTEGSEAAPDVTI